MDSIDLEGWLPKHPAMIELMRGRVPRIKDGNHRLFYLHKTGRPEMLVPVEVSAAWQQRSPLS